MLPHAKKLLHKQQYRLCYASLSLCYHGNHSHTRQLKQLYRGVTTNKFSKSQIKNLMKYLSEPWGNKWITQQLQRLHSELIQVKNPYRQIASSLYNKSYTECILYHCACLPFINLFHLLYQCIDISTMTSQFKF